MARISHRFGRRPGGASGGSGGAAAPFFSGSGSRPGSLIGAVRGRSSTTAAEALARSRVVAASISLCSKITSDALQHAEQLGSLAVVQSIERRPVHGRNNSGQRLFKGSSRL